MVHPVPRKLSSHPCELHVIFFNGLKFRVEFVPIQASHIIRVSSASHGYSVTRIDCINRRYQDLGYGEGRQLNVKMYDNVQWAELKSGSSKDNLVTFVCSHARP